MKLSVTELLLIDCLNKAYDADFKDSFQHPLINKKYGAIGYDLLTTNNTIIIPDETIEHSLKEKEKAWKDSLEAYRFKRKKTPYNKEIATEYYKTDLLCRFMQKLKTKEWKFKVIIDKERKQDTIIDFYKTV